MKAEFKDGFDSYVCEGDTITTEWKGITYTARLVRDDTHGIDDDDCHNVDQSVTGCNDEQQVKLLSARADWFAGEWWYCGVVISASKDDVTIDEHAASLWAIEANYPGDDNKYLLEVANELLDEAIEQAAESLARMVATLTA